jgi:hypothetical protein
MLAQKCDFARPDPNHLKKIRNLMKVPDSPAEQGLVNNP